MPKMVEDSLAPVTYRNEWRERSEKEGDNNKISNISVM